MPIEYPESWLNLEHRILILGYWISCSYEFYDDYRLLALEYGLLAWNDFGQNKNGHLVLRLTQNQIMAFL